ncbi:hypothetical protein TRAPUB_12224 [Trametes pubescens]|uniref:Uncharacterized protein n=1 Tax=Trametes pubescens TaxID=154538 RepID=A0A1M2VUI3_TRAPU|nr:hypothetical protein TRAPUB_12224 [Trametes pubescens]
MSALASTSTQASAPPPSSSGAQTSYNATPNTSATLRIPTVLAAALSTTLTLLAVSLVLLFLRWRRRYLKRALEARVPPTALRELHLLNTGGRQVVGDRVAWPFVRLADGADVSSVHLSSFRAETPWRTSEQHSVRAYDNGDVPPAVPTKAATRTVAARDSVLPSFPTDAYSARAGLVDTFPRTPDSLSLSFQHIPPPPPLRAFQPQRRISSTMLSSSMNTPITPDSPPRSSSAGADERFVVLPWPLGERLMALLSTAQGPEARVRESRSEGGCSEGLPAYASDE